MKKTLPLYLGPSVIGSVVIEENERHIRFYAKTYTSNASILRAYVRGYNGTFLIGVLAPDGAAFSASKSVSEATLVSSGLTYDDITYAFALEQEVEGAEKCEVFKSPAHIPDILCENKITYSLIKSSGALSNDDISPSKIAVPLFTGNPFPRPDILCLLTPTEIGGELYGVLGVSKDGEVYRLP